MTARYQSHNFTSASVAGGANSDNNRTGLPSLLNIVKILVTQDAPGGTFDFKVFKKDTFLAADLLYFADDVAPALYYPMDISSGSPAEAEEGPPIPYDDEDGTGELHIRITNNDGVAHTYTVTMLYEEVPLMSSTGGVVFRGTGQLTRLGIGAPADANYLLFLSGGSTTGSMLLQSDSAGGTAIAHYGLVSAAMQQYRTFYAFRGTIASPTQVMSADYLDIQGVYAYDNAATLRFQGSAGWIANANITAADQSSWQLANAAGATVFKVNVSNGNVLITGETEIDGNLNHDGSNIGFFGVTPAARASAYTPTNVTPDRAFDADTVVVAELADIVGTLIADLKTYGLLQ